MKHNVWKKRFELYKEYVEEYGIQPATTAIYKDFKIGIWLVNQKNLYQCGMLNEERLKMLNEYNEYWLGGDCRFLEQLECINQEDFWKTKTNKTSLMGVLDTETLYDCLYKKIYDCETYIEKYLKDAKLYEINIYSCFAKILNINVNSLVLFCICNEKKDNDNVLEWYRSFNIKSQEELDLILESYFENLKYKEVKVLLLRAGYYSNKPLTFREVGEKFQCTRANAQIIEKNAVNKIKENKIKVA
jgi:hypothetical protein